MDDYTRPTDSTPIRFFRAFHKICSIMYCYIAICRFLPPLLAIPRDTSCQMQSADLTFEFATTFYLPWPVAYCSTKLIILCFYICEMELSRRVKIKEKLSIFFIVLLFLWITYGMAFLVFKKYLDEAVGNFNMYSPACRKGINLLDLTNFTLVFLVSIFCSTTWLIQLLFVTISSPCICIIAFFVKNEVVQTERSQMAMVYNLWAKQYSKQK